MRMENDNNNDIITINIGNFSVAFYGGKEGFQNKCRAIVSLYDTSGATAGFIKFFNEGTDIENDGFDALKLFHLNLPDSSYLNVLDSLRSKRPLQLIFDGKTGILSENKLPHSKGRGINLN